MTADLRAEALAQFTEWFVKNYPGPETLIHDPLWHAPKVFRAAEHALAARLAFRPACTHSGGRIEDCAICTPVPPAASEPSEEVIARDILADACERASRLVEGRTTPEGNDIAELLMVAARRLRGGDA